MEALDYMYAVEEFSDRWDDFEDIDVQHNTETEEPAKDVRIAPVWDGRNWQDALDNDIQSISNTDPRLLGTKCPICQEDFATGQKVQKYRCGHAVCIGCFHEAVDLGWHRCSLCRNSSTARTAIIDPNSDVDLSVFIQPQNTAASAAAATTSFHDVSLSRT